MVKLHGREVKVGTMLWHIPNEIWVVVSDKWPGSGKQWIHMNTVINNADDLAWDDPAIHHKIENIQPPPCWVEGHPVRKGTALMDTRGFALVFDCVSDERPDVFEMLTYDGVIYNRQADELTFELPKCPVIKPKRVGVVRWYNIYATDESDDYCRICYATEQLAKEGSGLGCQGQVSFSYTVEVPTKKRELELVPMTPGVRKFTHAKGFYNNGGLTALRIEYVGEIGTLYRKDGSTEISSVSLETALRYVNEGAWKEIF